MAERFVVCGLGHVGYRVTSLLLDLGEQVSVVTLHARDTWLREVKERGADVVIGDARDSATLHQVRVSEAKALIACADNDLVNIEVALDVKRMSPHTKVVARLFDQNLARQIEGAIEIEQALAMSVIAAPAFASAAFGEELIAEFAVGPARYVVARIKSSDHEGFTIEEFVQKHGVEVLAHLVSDDQLEIDPAKSRSLQGTKTLKVIGERHSVEKLLKKRSRQPILVERDSRFLESISPFAAIGFLIDLWKNTSIQLRAVATLIFALTAVSVLVFSFGMNLNLLDALYFVITTLTTIGYGDITPRDSAPWLKAYGILLMLLGSAAVATLYSIVTDYLITSRLQQLIGRGRTNLNDHVIVAGVGNLGYHTVDELQRMGAKVVAVEPSMDGQHVTAIRAKTPVIIGDAREADTLRRAGVERAAAVVAATNDDTVNLSIGLSACKLNPSVRTVVRLFDAGFAKKVQDSLRIDVALSASRIAAPAFVGAALYPGAVSSFTLHDKLFTLVLRPIGAAIPGGRMLLRVGDQMLVAFVRDLAPPSGN